jgi:hypothetical protein
MPGKNPFTGELMTIKARPARNVVRAVPMKALKEMAEPVRRVPAR